MASRYGLEIRALTPADAPGLAELLAAVGAPAATPAALAERIVALRAEPGVALAAHEWGPPSGIIVLHWRRTLLADAATAWVSTLLVGPDERRRGIGRLLLKAGAQAARQAGCADLLLTAGEDQPELRAFCEATGFSAAGVGYVRPLRRRA